jgi:hypothetical protein
MGICPVVPYNSIYLVCSRFNVWVRADFFAYVIPGIAVEKVFVCVVEVATAMGVVGSGVGGIGTGAAATTGDAAAAGGGGTVFTTCTGGGVVVVAAATGADAEAGAMAEAGVT